MKISMLKAVVASSVLVGLAMSATSANAATASATARAKILRPLTIANTTDLNFGTIVTDGTASSVVINAGTGAVTCNTGLICGGTPTRAHFNLTGSNVIVNISLPAGVSLAGPGTAMPVTFARSANTVTLASNAGSFDIGGTLTVNAAQADGDYSVSFSQVADYQ
jgi:Mat/Ecp fimbriae major subunit